MAYPFREHSEQVVNEGANSVAASDTSDVKVKLGLAELIFHALVLLLLV